MKWIAVERTLKGFSVRHCAAAPDGAVQVNVTGQAPNNINALALSLRQRVGEPIWGLEFSKFVVQNQCDGFYEGYVLAETALSNTTVITAGLVSDSLSALSGALFRLKAADVATSAGLLWRLRTSLQFGSGVILGFMAWLMTLMRFGWASAKLPKSGSVIAIYGELSNRTRHLLPPAFEHGPTPSFIVVGRPRLALADIVAALDPQGQLTGKSILRAISWRSAAGSAGVAIRLLASGAERRSTASLDIPVRECAAMTFRVLQGACEAHWWRSQASHPEVALFGLTGLADTAQLEAAMIESGTRTIHCVHGVSLGWNFAAYSSLGVFVSGYDANLAERLSSYHKTTFSARPAPAAAKGGEGWLLLTSYTHPMSLEYQRHGIAADREAIDLAVAAAGRMTGQRPRITWKPHPAIANVEKQDAANLVSHAVAAGLTLWGNDASLSSLASYRHIITTPSTAAIDALIAGKTPILLSTRPLQDDICYRRLTMIAHDAEELHRCIETVERDPEQEFIKAWDAVRPGSKLRSHSEVLRLLADELSPPS